MSDWFIATEGVKIVKDSASLWPQIITAVSAAGAALGGVCLTHYFARGREENAAAERQALAEDERQKALLYIATELIFPLQQFGGNCTLVAADSGVEEDNGEFSPGERLPVLDLTAVSGDWRVLPPRLMFRIRELPGLEAEARSDIAFIRENDGPPDYQNTFRARKYRYACLGIKAFILAMRLRKLAGFPEIRVKDRDISDKDILWSVWRTNRRRIALQTIKRQQREKDYR